MFARIRARLISGVTCCDFTRSPSFLPPSRPTRIPAMPTIRIINDIDAFAAQFQSESPSPELSSHPFPEEMDFLSPTLLQQYQQEMPIKGEPFIPNTYPATTIENHQDSQAHTVPPQAPMSNTALFFNQNSTRTSNSSNHYVPKSQYQVSPFSSSL